MGYIIRKAAIADATTLRDCMIAAYSAYLHSPEILSLPPLEVDYAAEISNYPTWVAEREAKIVGGLIMTFATDAAMILNIAVHPVAQGSGLGRGLLDFAEQQARERGYSRMRLATHALLSENVSLYCYLGWEVTEEDAVRVTMEKSIA